MKISDIRVRIVKNETSKIKASVSLTIDDAIIVHDIKVIEGREEGTYFIAMPSRKTNEEGEAKYKDTVHPANTETREMLSELILKAFNEAVKNQAE